jgi:hypothetical protein
MLSQFDNDRPVIMRCRFPRSNTLAGGANSGGHGNATSGDTGTQTGARQHRRFVTKSFELPWCILTSSTLLPIAAGLSTYERTG